MFCRNSIIFQKNTIFKCLELNSFRPRLLFEILTIVGIVLTISEFKDNIMKLEIFLIIK